jgi:hypothetical protein
MAVSLAGTKVKNLQTANVAGASPVSGIAPVDKIYS